MPQFSNPFGLPTGPILGPLMDLAKEIAAEANTLATNEHIDMTDPGQKAIVDARAEFNVEAQHGHT